MNVTKKLPAFFALMAALCGCGVDNILVELDGPEVPILDGSAEPFIEVLREAGLREQNVPRKCLVIERPLLVRDGDAYIKEHGIFMIPDFLANAGGVTCSYFEQVQSNLNYYWEKEEVLGKLDAKMTAAFIAVNELARKKKLFMRDAAYVIAIDRVATASKSRGWV